jgi:hypothetical protein
MIRKSGNRFSDKIMLNEKVYSAFTPAALMIGHHLAISAS